MRSEERDDMTTATSGGVAESSGHGPSGAGAQILRRFGHSLRSPLNEIAATARLMLSEAIDSDDRQNLARIEDAADQILDVLNDLLDVAELEGGHLSVQTVPFRLPDVIREAVRSQRALASERDVELSVHGLGALPTDLVGGAGRIRQVLGHIVGDSVRAASIGRVQVAAQMVEQSPERATIRFGVRRPTPLTPEQFDDILRPLAAEDISGSRTDGLSLVIASKVIEAMGGRLAVSPGTGDRLLEFTLSFSRAEPVEDETEVEADNNWVLVVSDNAAAGEEIVSGLRVGGFEPTLHESVALASTAISLSDDSSAIPAVIVLAPRGKPFEAAARAVASPVLSRSRIVLVVSHGERGDSDECIRLGVEGYFPQPVTSVDLIEGVTLLAARKTDGPLVTRHALRERRKQLHVLVADDSPTGRAVVMRSLEQLGHSTAGVANGRAALDLVRTQNFDVIVMDMEMPEMGGVDATRAIRALPTIAARTPIVGLSAHAFSTDREACLDAGMNEHFTKPFRIEELQIAMERMTRS
jgi:CheY-like chemotaxis protein